MTHKHYSLQSPKAGMSLPSLRIWKGIYLYFEVEQVKEWQEILQSEAGPDHLGL